MASDAEAGAFPAGGPITPPVGAPTMDAGLDPDPEEEGVGLVAPALAVGVLTAFAAPFAVTAADGDAVGAVTTDVAAGATTVPFESVTFALAESEAPKITQENYF